jgi:hypothetical protein
VQGYISVKVVTLEGLFSDSYHFRLPYFQRAYAWRTAEVGRLLADVAEAMTLAEDRRHYFLGKLMLAKKADAPETALVDGHQRVMTLTLLFVVLRDLEEEPARKARLAALVASDHGPRLSPPDEQAEFCRRYIQEPGATGVELDQDMADLSETERNIIENRNALRGELISKDWTPERRWMLAEFLMTGCCVIISSVEDEDMAWKFLRIEEETGVAFNCTDSAKWSLLSIVPQTERIQCQRVWERCESLLGSADLHALLAHLRTMKWRRRSERPVEIDIAKGYRLNAAGHGLAFLEGELLPNAIRLAALRRPSTAEGPIRGTPRECAERMSWVNPQLWVPAALMWISKERSDEETAQFFKLLERLVWMMRISGCDPTRQQGRIILLLGEIERELRVEHMRELLISAATRDAVLNNLRSPTFDSKHYDACVLRRISIALGQDPGPVHPQALTIEHLLPRGFAQKSGWRKHFPTRASVQAHAHRLGNLSFLTAAENQAADTLDWADKRPILARSKLVLANRLAATQDWTPLSITSRTEELIRILFLAWDLDSKG